jgi:hypothetical protein
MGDADKCSGALMVILLTIACCLLLVAIVTIDYLRRLVEWLRQDGGVVALTNEILVLKQASEVEQMRHNNELYEALLRYEDQERRHEASLRTLQDEHQVKQLSILIERFPSRVAHFLEYEWWQIELTNLEGRGLNLATNNAPFGELLNRVRADAAWLRSYESRQDYAEIIAHCRDCLGYLEGVWQTNLLEANTPAAPAPSRRSGRL